MADIVVVRNVFKSLGQPIETYVSRDSGKFEHALEDALDARGKLCLLTGPSKTGKTTLYTRVLSDRELYPLVIRCDSTLTPEELWKRALEKVDFERLSAIQTSKSSKEAATGKLGGTIGWKWLAGLLGEVSVGVEKNMGEVQVRDKILATACPDHLIPIVKNLPAVLVVEDFHYLNRTAKRTVFQQWKTFIDNEVSVIVVGTTHHAVDLAYANRDLVGRIAQIDLSTWSLSDLEKIAIQGFDFLKLGVSRTITSAIAKEAAGLPIIVQETCSGLLMPKDIREMRPGKLQLNFQRADVYTTLHSVAKTHYAQFEAIYQRLVTGPRKKARKYDTYELVMAAFTKDPLTFSLKRHELDERIAELPIPEDRRPPAASVNGTLKALGTFQKRNGIELLEWSEVEHSLYILEPAFLFYLRWREPRTMPPNILDLMKGLFGFDWEFLMTAARRSGRRAAGNAEQR